jgi:hypothetical protein
MSSTDTFTTSTKSTATTTVRFKSYDSALSGATREEARRGCLKRAGVVAVTMRRAYTL